MQRAETKKLCDMMASEVDRALSHLRRHTEPKPYYISYLVRDERIWRIQARYGALHTQGSYRRRDCLADVRVGGYRYDQVQEGGLNDNSTEEESYSYVDLPFGGDLDGVRHALWRLTDARYREAMEAFLRKKADELTYLNTSRHLPAFEKREPRVDLQWRALPEVDSEYWTRFVKKASETQRAYADVKTSHVEFQCRQSVRTFVSSEGARVVQCQGYYSLDAYLWLLSDSGDAFPWTVTRYVTDPSELPDLKSFCDEIKQTVKLLRELAKAPVVRSFSGPVLLEPGPAGLLIHEALGHRLEGNRLLSPGEGQTFRDTVGQRVLPEFLSMYDDASLDRFEQQSLVGHYRFDDEGVPAQRATLIDHGVLKGFLTSRAGIDKRHKSNGHGRSRFNQRAISRMAVTVVESHQGLSKEDLRARLVEEIKRQGVPYGIRIVRADGGETATEGYNFQAFLGDINLATRVFPDGREELIRGVNFVGTPLNAVRSIVAAGNDYYVDNAQCGAESGYLPVSTISPSLLVGHLELQSKSEHPYTQYTYPIPWADHKKSPGKSKPGKRAARGGKRAS
ncbi:MAG: hypothetical protein H6718_00905 [Polyangiaceae bacterium]|nr:hypothetical protein [Polyangiaceae bacterium]MCB9607822.1 hypothetical protein [Polyangiaceae bacterium]